MIVIVVTIIVNVAWLVYLTLSLNNITQLELKQKKYDGNKGFNVGVILYVWNWTVQSSILYIVKC